MNKPGDDLLQNLAIYLLGITGSVIVFQAGLQFIAVALIKSFR